MLVRAKRTRGRNIGRACTMVLEYAEQRAAEIEDLHAFHAPSECYPLVRKGAVREHRRLRRRVKAVTGLKWVEFVREVDRRTSPRTSYFRLGLGAAEYPGDGKNREGP